MTKLFEGKLQALLSGRICQKLSKCQILAITLKTLRSRLENIYSQQYDACLDRKTVSISSGNRRVRRRPAVLFGHSDVAPESQE